MEYRIARFKSRPLKPPLHSNNGHPESGKLVRRNQALNRRIFLLSRIAGAYWQPQIVLAKDELQDKEIGMGLFDFAADLGKKLFGDDDDPSEKIKQHIESTNPGIDGLKVEVKNGIAKVSGNAKDQPAFEKMVLMAGNVMGIKEVQAEELVVEEPADQNVEFYVIEKGDTLWAIAQKYLGNGNKYTKIFEDNREVIKDPDLIYPGQKIRIVLD